MLDYINGVNFNYIVINMSIYTARGGSRKASNFSLFLFSFFFLFLFLISFLFLYLKKKGLLLFSFVYFYFYFFVGAGNMWPKATLSSNNVEDIWVDGPSTCLPLLRSITDICC